MTNDLEWRLKAVSNPASSAGSTVMRGYTVDATCRICLDRCLALRMFVRMSVEGSVSVGKVMIIKKCEG